MRVSLPCVVTLEFEALLEGRLVQRTSAPRAVLLGAERDLPPGLEAALVGRTAGEHFTVVVPDAYGMRDETKVVTVARAALPSATLEVGATFSARGDDGEAFEARVVELGAEFARLDLNPARAGLPLELRVFVHAVRPAEAHELEHGHAHGEGGVHH